jgi:hypothetical protein
VADLQWEQFTLGQNKVIQDIASAASKASALVEVNATIAKTVLETGKVLLMGLLNPQLLLLVAIADEIDNFVNDFKGTGFYILEIVPTGNEILPKDVDGNPIKILLSPISLTASYSASAIAGFGDQWIDWFKVISGGETDPNNPQRSTYFVDQKKSKAEADRTENANDDSVTDIDPVFGFPKMTPSTVISQIVAAMDEEADINRPNFSSSAEVAGIVVIIGFSDLTKNMGSLKAALEAFIKFFGGENGLFTKGLMQMHNIIKGGFDALAKEDGFQTVIKVKEVSGVRGTDEDSKVLKKMKIDYNFEKGFEENDLVVGPVRMFGGTAGKGRAMGIVTKAETTSNEPRAPYSSQELTLTCLSSMDKYAFDHLCNGNVIQRVAYVKGQKSHIDQNTGELIKGPEFNDYEYMQDTTDADGLSFQQMKVKKVAGEVLLQKAADRENIIESLTRSTGYADYSTVGITEKYQTKNEVIGKIDRPKVAVENKGIPPNFKKAKLEDLMDELKIFFEQIQRFTNGMRDFASGATEELAKVIEYLDGKIAEIDELNKSIQAILAIFTIGIPDSGVYVLSIPTTTGGNEAIKEALSSATNGPPNTLDYSVGFMMMGGGPSMKPLQLLLTGG